MDEEIVIKDASYLWGKSGGFSVVSFDNRGIEETIKDGFDTLEKARAYAKDYKKRLNKGVVLCY